MLIIRTMYLPFLSWEGRFVENPQSFQHRFLRNHCFMIKITEHTSFLQRFGNLQLEIYLHGKAKQLLEDKCMCVPPDTLFLTRGCSRMPNARFAG